MTPALPRALLLRRLRSPTRALFLLAVLAQDLAQVCISGQAGPADGLFGGLATLVLGLGLLAQERSDGSLAVLLTRPVARAQLVMSAWLAASAGGVLAWLTLSLLRTLLLALPAVDSPGRWETWSVQALMAVGSAAGLAAVAVFFGTAFRGLAALAAQAGLTYAAVTLAGAAREWGRPGFERAAQEAMGLLLPVPDWTELLAEGGWSWYQPLAALSNITLLLVASTWLLARAQLSYSSGD